jgi:hypothetical protein
MQRRITRGVTVILGKTAFHKLFNLAFQTQVGDDESGGILPFYRATTMSRFI